MTRNPHDELWRVRTLVLPFYAGTAHAQRIEPYLSRLEKALDDRDAAAVVGRMRDVMEHCRIEPDDVEEWLVEMGKLPRR